MPEEQPVAPNSITADQNVYIVAHGWAPGYLQWVDAVEAPLANGGQNSLPRWWNTLLSTPQSPNFDTLPSGSTGAGGGSPTAPSWPSIGCTTRSWR